MRPNKKNNLDLKDLLCKFFFIIFPIVGLIVYFLEENEIYILPEIDSGYWLFKTLGFSLTLLGLYSAIHGRDNGDR